MGKKPAAPNLLKLAARPNKSFAHEIERLAKQHLKKLVKLCVAAQSGDVDAIHDMRIATRRIRALIRLRRNYSKNKELKPLAAFAKELGHQLGAVRAEDMLIEGLDNIAQSEAVRSLKLAISFRRAARADQLGVLLRSRTFHDWCNDLSAELIRDLNDEDLVSDLASEAIRRAWSVVGARRSIAKTANLAELHALRIDAKKFRYVLEFFGHATPWNAKETLIRLVEIQDHLGALHDDDLLLQEIRAASAMTGQWNPKEAKALAAAAHEVEENLRRRLESAPKKWEFLFSQELTDHFGP